MALERQVAHVERELEEPELHPSPVRGCESGWASLEVVGEGGLAGAVTSVQGSLSAFQHLHLGGKAPRSFSSAHA
jgi:hypothetical protein